jgi:hypothetical protein
MKAATAGGQPKVDMSVVIVGKPGGSKWFK